MRPLQNRCIILLTISAAIIISAVANIYVISECFRYLTSYYNEMSVTVRAEILQLHEQTVIDRFHPLVKWISPHLQASANSQLSINVKTRLKRDLSENVRRFPVEDTNFQHTGWLETQRDSNELTLSGIKRIKTTTEPPLEDSYENTEFRNNKHNIDFVSTENKHTKLNKHNIDFITTENKNTKLNSALSPTKSQQVSRLLKLKDLEHNTSLSVPKFSSFPTPSLSPSTTLFSATTSSLFVQSSTSSLPTISPPLSVTSSTISPAAILMTTAIKNESLAIISSNIETSTANLEGVFNLFSSYQSRIRDSTFSQASNNSSIKNSQDATTANNFKQQFVWISRSYGGNENNIENTSDKTGGKDDKVGNDSKDTLTSDNSRTIVVKSHQMRKKSIKDSLSQVKQSKSESHQAKESVEQGSVIANSNEHKVKLRRPLATKKRYHSPASRSQFIQHLLSSLKGNLLGQHPLDSLSLTETRADSSDTHTEKGLKLKDIIKSNLLREQSLANDNVENLVNGDYATDHKGIKETDTSDDTDYRKLLKKLGRLVLNHRQYLFKTFDESTANDLKETLGKSQDKPQSQLGHQLNVIKESTTGVREDRLTNIELLLAKLLQKFEIQAKTGNEPIQPVPVNLPALNFHLPDSPNNIINPMLSILPENSATNQFSPSSLLNNQIGLSPNAVNNLLPSTGNALSYSIPGHQLPSMQTDHQLHQVHPNALITGERSSQASQLYNLNNVPNSLFYQRTFPALTNAAMYRGHSPGDELSNPSYNPQIVNQRELSFEHDHNQHIESDEDDSRSAPSTKLKSRNSMVRLGAKTQKQLDDNNFDTDEENGDVDYADYGTREKKSSFDENDDTDKSNIDDTDKSNIDDDNNDDYDAVKKKRKRKIYDADARSINENKQKRNRKILALSDEAKTVQDSTFYEPWINYNHKNYILPPHLQQFLASTLISTTSSSIQPVYSTTQSVLSTTQPVQSTTQPVYSTTQPVLSTTQPVLSTSQPIQSTTQSVLSTTQLLRSTQKFKPVQSTNKISLKNTASSKPVNSTVSTQATTKSDISKQTTVKSTQATVQPIISIRTTVQLTTSTQATVQPITSTRTTVKLITSTQATVQSSKSTLGLQPTSSTQKTVKLTTSTPSTVQSIASIQATVQPTTSTQATVQPTTSGQSAVQPTTSTQSAVQPITSTKSAVQLTTSTKSAVQPTTSTKSAVQSTTSTKSAVQPTTSTKSAVQPITSRQSAVQPTTSTQSSLQPTTSTQSAVQPTTSAGATVQPTTSTQAIVKSTQLNVQPTSLTTNTTPFTTTIIFNGSLQSITTVVPTPPITSVTTTILNTTTKAAITKMQTRRNTTNTTSTAANATVTTNQLKIAIKPMIIRTSNTTITATALRSAVAITPTPTRPTATSAIAAAAATIASAAASTSTLVATGSSAIVTKARPTLSLTSMKTLTNSKPTLQANKSSN